MRIEFRQAYHAPKQTVWNYLHDKDVLVRTMPGCRKLQSAGQGHYLIEMGLDIGPVKGLFTGTVDLLELDEPNQYRLVLKGSGKPGDIQADSQIRLEMSGAKTDVYCNSEVHMTGMLASFGQRIMGGVAKLLLSRFFKNVEGEIRKSAMQSRQA